MGQTNYVSSEKSRRLKNKTKLDNYRNIISISKKVNLRKIKKKFNSFLVGCLVEKIALIFQLIRTSTTVVAILINVILV